MAPRVEVRPLEAGDADRIRAWRDRPDAPADLHADHPISPESRARWLARVEGDPSRRHWVITLDGAPVGLADLHDIDRGNQRCAWGYYLAEPAARGLGLGAYVEYWVLEYVFEGLRLAKLWCEVLASNERVWKLHETFGFHVEARFRGHMVQEGERVDVLGLGMLAADWRARRPAMAERLKARGLEPPVVA
jgi:UDP-4-amino-4,6-dideoxy-N-acetyl-beta-L-altrosamine N-acetyltransferase